MTAQLNLKTHEDLIIRKAQIDDCHELWLWRNHLEVKRWCFKTDEIPYKQHEKWFEQALKDEKKTIFIIENSKKQKLGQVRFEIEKEHSASININLNPQFFNQGIGSFAIKLATEVFLRLNPSLQEIVAGIMEGNISSQKSFEKAGYIFERNGIRHSRKINILNFKNQITA